MCNLLQNHCFKIGLGSKENSLDFYYAAENPLLKSTPDDIGYLQTMLKN